MICRYLNCTGNLFVLYMDWQKVMTKRSEKCISITRGHPFILSVLMIPVNWYPADELFSTFESYKLNKSVQSRNPTRPCKLTCEYARKLTCWEIRLIRGERTGLVGKYPFYFNSHYKNEMSKAHVAKITDMKYIYKRYNLFVISKEVNVARDFLYRC